MSPLKPAFKWKWCLFAAASTGFAFYLFASVFLGSFVRLSLDFSSEDFSEKLLQSGVWSGRSVAVKSIIRERANLLQSPQAAPKWHRLMGKIDRGQLIDCYADIFGAAMNKNDFDMASRIMAMWYELDGEASLRQIGTPPIDAIISGLGPKWSVHVQSLWPDMIDVDENGVIREKEVRFVAGAFIYQKPLLSIELISKYIRLKSQPKI